MAAAGLTIWGLVRASINVRVSGSRPRKEGGTTLQRISPPAAATAAVDLPASMSEVVVEVVEVVEAVEVGVEVVVEEVAEVAKAVEAVEVVVEVAEAVEAVMVAPAPATVDGPAAATGWPAAAVDAPAGSCCGAWGAPGGCCGA